MRMQRVAILSGTAAAIGGLIWWRRAKAAEADENGLVDLSTSSNGHRPTDADRDGAESELSL